MLVSAAHAEGLTFQQLNLPMPRWPAEAHPCIFQNSSLADLVGLCFLVLLLRLRNADLFGLGTFWYVFPAVSAHGEQAKAPSNPI